MGNTLRSKRSRHLRKAIRNNDVTTLERLIRMGMNLDAPVNVYSKHTPLILATCDGSHDVIKLLLGVCRFKNRQNREGHTALDKAVTYYSLANEFVRHRPSEIQKRKRILALLVEGGCHVVRNWEFELWIRVNKTDVLFLQNIAQILSKSKHQHLLSLSLAVMLRVNAPAQCAIDLLSCGATYDHFKQMHEEDGNDRQLLSNELCITMIKSTNDFAILRHIVNIKLNEESNNKEAIPKHIFLLLLLSDYRYKTAHLSTLTGSSLERMMANYEDRVLSLKNMCRVTIRRTLHPNILFCAPKLPLPKKLQYFISFHVLY